MYCVIRFLEGMKMSGVIRHIVNECLRLISEHRLNEQQLDELVSSLSLELLKIKEGSE